MLPPPIAPPTPPDAEDPPILPPKSIPSIAPKLDFMELYISKSGDNNPGLLVGPEAPALPPAILVTLPVPLDCKISLAACLRPAKLASGI